MRPSKPKVPGKRGSGGGSASEAARPDGSPLEGLRRAAAGCTACALYRRATQTVFGEGPAHAALMLVGEQPGHEEDLKGKPFVGPAGRMLDRALEDAGLDRGQVYVTNAVKHFKWKLSEGGKRRIHDRPRQTEVEACRPWFQQELSLVQPQILVCLGATAARAVLGRAVTISSARGHVLRSQFGPPVVVTLHPSAILRAPTDAERQTMLRWVVRDLEHAWSMVGGRASSTSQSAPGARLAGSRRPMRLATREPDGSEE
jgi:uracil-DNA glycosylase family protein